MKWFLNTDKIKVCNSPWYANKFTYKRLTFSNPNTLDLTILQIFPLIMSLCRAKRIIKVKPLAKS